VISAEQPPGDDRSRGLGTMLRIVARIQWRSALIWALALGASMVGTAASVASLYDTPAKIHTYAAAVTTGSALAAINGTVEGIDSLGGVIQDEFGFLIAFLIPLLGISLIARATRGAEASGQLELLLGGRIARQQPPVAALLVATATIVATAALFAVGLAVFGVPLVGAVLYALSLVALGFVFAGLAALLAQLTPHPRGVYTWSLIILAGSFALRGIGDVTKTWVAWLSPLGWAEKAAPFGDQRWWALLIPLAVGLTLSSAAARLASRRDLGSALVRGGAGPDRATARLRNPIGFAVWIHRPAILGWLAGGVLFAGLMGALSHQFLAAMAGNPAVANAIGIGGGRPVDGLIAATQLYLAVIGAGYLVQAISTLRTEESNGRLENRLSGTLSRPRWLAAHAVILLGGLVTIVLGSSLVLGLATGLSAGNMAEFGPTLTSGLAYLPAELVLGGIALLVYGIHPRLFGIAWAGYAAMTFIAFLGPGLKLSQWVLDLSPTTHVGNPPMGAVQTGALIVMSAVAAALIAAGFVVFRRRDVPQS
jgi:ABC-2 type transport system permease protein